MKAAVVYGVDDVRMEEFPDPSAGPGEVVIRTKAAGICSQDVRMMLNGQLPLHLPGIPGHDLAGEISEIGPGLRGFAPDDPVAVYSLAACGKCANCGRGRHDLCSAAVRLGHGLNGAYSEYVRIPKEIVSAGGIVRLDEAISLEDAALAEPLSCTFAAARANRMKEGQHVLIVGGGSAGLMHLKTAKWTGCKVITADCNDTRLAMAGQMGSDHLINSAKNSLHDEVMRITGGQGAEVVILSVSIPALLEDCCKLTAKGGTCNLFGMEPGAEAGIDRRRLEAQGISLTGPCLSTPGDFRKCLQLIREEAIIVSDMISHRFTLDSFSEAIDAAKNQALVRGIITFGEMFSLSF